MVHGRCFSGIPKKLCMCVQRKTMAGRGIYLKDNLSAKRGFGADPSNETDQIRILFGTGGWRKGMNKKRNPQDKAKIVMEFINTSISAAELCRKHNTYLRPHSKTGKTSSCKEAGRPS